MSRSPSPGWTAAARTASCCTLSAPAPSQGPPMARRRTEAGFTMLEMVVVVAVMGFLMVGLAEGQRFGFRAWKHQSDMIADHDQFDAVDRTLRQLLTHVEMQPGTDPGTLSFTGILPAAVALGTRRADMDLMIDPDHQLI